jgi:hypothetical protein
LIAPTLAPAFKNSQATIYVAVKTLGTRMHFNKFAASSAILLALAVLSAPVKIAAVVAPYDAGSDSQIFPKRPEAHPSRWRYYDGFDPRLAGVHGPYGFGEPQQQHASPGH